MKSMVFNGLDASGGEQAGRVLKVASFPFAPFFPAINHLYSRFLLVLIVWAAWGEHEQEQ